MKLEKEYEKELRGLSKIQKRKKLEEYYNQRKRWTPSAKKEIATSIILYPLTWLVKYYFRLINVTKETSTEAHLREVRELRDRWVDQYL